MSATITTLQATQIATAYHDVMTMINNPSHPYHTSTSPRRVLETYLQISKITGVKMHNDSWEQRAEKIVDDLMQKRMAAYKLTFKGRKDKS